VTTASRQIGPAGDSGGNRQQFGNNNNNNINGVCYTKGEKTTEPQTCHRY